MPSVVVRSRRLVAAHEVPVAHEVSVVSSRDVIHAARATSPVLCESRCSGMRRRRLLGRAVGVKVHAQVNLPRGAGEDGEVYAGSPTGEGPRGSGEPEETRMASTSMVGGTPGRGGTGTGDGDGDGDGDHAESAPAGRGDHAESEPAGAALEGRSLQDARTGAGERGWRRERRARGRSRRGWAWRRSSCANQGAWRGRVGTRGWTGPSRRARARTPERARSLRETETSGRRER